ncbi:hypothetical protein HK414_23655 [Ramlibacter terrae]|uniref:Uncharacterized protein n=1 Tax=Ramlibacter terrae TaxID=2732511 RepID=A0ABX6P595_9BURK|nr:hypothetical protein HK414_23655 [Ramlibacter terrae]
MSASQSHALHTIAVQLATALDHYELEFNALMRNWPEMEMYAGVSRRMDELRMYSASLPVLSVQYVSLLIAHAELVHALWKTQTRGGYTAVDLANVREDHRAAIADLRRKCLRLLAGMAAAREGS